MTLASLFAALIVAAIWTPTFAQSPEKSNSQSGFLPSILVPDDTFAQLKKDRRNIATSIESQENDIRRLDAELSSLLQRAEFDQDRAARVERNLESIESAITQRSRPGFRPSTPKSGPRSYEEYLSSLPDLNVLEKEKKEQLSQRDELKKREEKIAQLRKDIESKKTELPAKRDKLFDLEERISDLLDTSRNQYVYRAGVSVIFAAIVFFLVLKFFRVVDSDDKVKQSIFTGDTGIQFITLFSIVIAVILFGILGILGANELSALLGGLSGYILGKSNVAKSVNGGSTSTTP